MFLVVFFVIVAMWPSLSYQSRFLNKSKSSAIVPSATTIATNPDDDNTGDDSDSKYGTGRSRYLALKERRSRLARSRSSHNFGLGDDNDDLDEPVSPTTASPSAYLASRCGHWNSLVLCFVFFLVFLFLPKQHHMKILLTYVRNIHMRKAVSKIMIC